MGWRDECDAYAVAKYVRVSPKKAKRVADLVKGMKALDAITMLQFVKAKPAKYIRETIKSAVANATHNFNLPADSLWIKSIQIHRGPMLKRWKPAAFGRAVPIRRRTSHIVVMLESRVETSEGE